METTVSHWKVTWTTTLAIAGVSLTPHTTSHYLYISLIEIMTNLPAFSVQQGKDGNLGGFLVSVLQPAHSVSRSIGARWWCNAGAGKITLQAWWYGRIEEHWVWCLAVNEESSIDCFLMFCSFGSKCFPCLMKYKRKKLSLVIVPCVMIFGYWFGVLRKHLYTKVRVSWLIGWNMHTAYWLLDLCYLRYIILIILTYLVIVSVTSRFNEQPSTLQSNYRTINSKLLTSHATHYASWAYTLARGST